MMTWNLVIKRGGYFILQHLKQQRHLARALSSQERQPLFREPVGVRRLISANVILTVW